MNWDMYWN